MLAEMLTKIEELAKRANGAETLTFEKRTLVRKGADYEWIDKPPPDRNHTILGIEDFCVACEDPKIAPDAEVYYDRTKVVALLNREDRREKVTLPLTKTQRFVVLEQLAKSPMSMTVAQAVKFLRFELHDAGTGLVLQAIKRIDFTRKGVGNATAEHGRETLGRSVEMIVQQADQVPETFIANIPVYATPGLRGFDVNVTVGVYLDTTNEAIVLQTLSDEIEGAYVATMDELGSILCGRLGPAPCLFGCPRCDARRSAARRLLTPGCRRPMRPFP